MSDQPYYAMEALSEKKEPAAHQAASQLGVGGFPRAMPHFGCPAEDGIRHRHMCCGDGPGPNVPSHWYDGGIGWVTRYFYDTVPRNPETYEPGKFRCQVVQADGKRCDHEIEDDDCCKKTCCWHNDDDAPWEMLHHAMQNHGASMPPKRQWSSDLFDTDGCLDAWLCAPCVGSRMMMALSGWENRLDWGWCLFFTLVGIRIRANTRVFLIYWLPPQVIISYFTRSRMKTLNNIDEGWCTTACTSCFCPVCSIAQTYRELTASGVWPGGFFEDAKPTYYGSIVKQMPIVQAMV